MEEDSDDSDADSSDEDDSDHEIPGLAIARPSSNPSSSKASDKGQAVPQTEVLYAEAGQFNPAKARAEKKRQKKAKKLSLGDDFNFTEAFADEVQLGDESEPEDTEDDSEGAPEDGGEESDDTSASD